VADEENIKPKMREKIRTWTSWISETTIGWTLDNWSLNDYLNLMWRRHPLRHFVFDCDGFWQKITSLKDGTPIVISLRLLDDYNGVKWNRLTVHACLGRHWRTKKRLGKVCTDWKWPAAWACLSCVLTSVVDFRPHPAVLVRLTSLHWRKFNTAELLQHSASNED
jgi:hypothetical protein